MSTDEIKNEFEKLRLESAEQKILEATDSFYWRYDISANTLLLCRSSCLWCFSSYINGANRID